MVVDLTPLIQSHEDEPALHQRVAALYDRVDAEAAAHAPVCVNRGTCCRFDEFGHRLFVTPVEVAFFVGRQRVEGLRPVTAEACPYQIDNRCTARSHRPLGCRIFFCDPAATHWQPGVYEKYLSELKQIGADLDVDYRYVDWLAALRSVSGAG